MDIIDATCKDVKLSHDIIRNYLDAGYMILYYGMENHPEAEGVLGISPKITLIRNKDDIEALPAYEGKLALATQTTMSFCRRLNCINIY